MFARTRERNMLSVRAVLLAAWLILIASLLWDPLTLSWTQADQSWSPFRVTQMPVVVQGRALNSVPYHLSNRIFWTMVVPLLPLFLMVFGHEAWRRVCPLSFASQLPRYFGLQRRRASLQRRTGRVERSPVLVKSDSWLRKNAWYVQLGLLWAGLCTRLLFINSSRWALAVALLAVIGAAVTVGAIWGGKTWCNFFCPVNVVQRIYTEPRGILESAPHLSRARVTQSMCRSSTATGDKSACVACTSLCGDIDLERSYWEDLQAPYRRNVYYIFWGLIIGFYGYYFLYAGSWSYYFSGIWTHEPDQLSQLFLPGLYIDGRLIGVPKLVAAPATLALAGALALVLGKSLEALYRRLRRGRLTEIEVVHHALCFSAYLSINTFYLFGGRPNINLLPNYAVHAVDVLIVSLTTGWLWQALQRTPLRYRRESLASSLIEQLRKLPINVGKYFEGRTIDQLKPDEVYVLAKVLPDVSQEHKLVAYRSVLADAISSGKTESAQFLDSLAELRVGMGIDDVAHARIVEELGIAADVSFDAHQASQEERVQCLANYVEMMGALILGKVEASDVIEDVLEAPDVLRSVAILRGSFQIGDSDHEAALQAIRGSDGLLARRLDDLIEQLKMQAAARFCILSARGDDAFWNALTRLILQAIRSRIDGMYPRLLATLHAIDDAETRRGVAAALVRLDGSAALAAAGRYRAAGRGKMWREVLPADVVAILDSSDTDSLVSAAHHHRDLVRLSRNPIDSLDVLLGHPDPVARALALTTFGYIEPELARRCAERLLTDSAEDMPPVLRTTAEEIVAPDSVGATSVSHQGETHVTVRRHSKKEKRQTFGLARISIGRGVANDVAVNHRAVAPYHLILHRNGDVVELIRLDDNPLFVDGVACRQGAASLGRGSVLSFGDDGGPLVSVDWEAADAEFFPIAYDLMTRLVWLSRFPDLQSLDLKDLERIARVVEVRRYGFGSLLEHRDQSAVLVMIQAGRVAELPLQQAAAAEVPHDAEEILPGEALLLDDDVAPSLRVTSPFAILFILRDAELLASFQRQRPADRIQRPMLEPLTAVTG